MARRPTMPPVVTEVQGLSGVIPRTFADDFTGETLPMKPGKFKPGIDPNAHDRKRQQARVEAARSVLIAAGRGDLVGYRPKPRLVKPEVKGMRPIRVIRVDGQAMAVYMAADPIRRGR